MGPHSKREADISDFRPGVCADGDRDVVGGCCVRDSAVRYPFIIRRMLFMGIVSKEEENWKIDCDGTGDGTGYTSTHLRARHGPVPFCAKCYRGSRRPQILL